MSQSNKENPDVLIRQAQKESPPVQQIYADQYNDYYLPENLYENSNSVHTERKNEKSTRNIFVQKELTKHIVGQNDYLYTIAKKYNITLSELLYQNRWTLVDGKTGLISDGQSEFRIKKGMEISIPETRKSKALVQNTKQIESSFSSSKLKYSPELMASFAKDIPVPEQDVLKENTRDPDLLKALEIIDRHKEKTKGMSVELAYYAKENPCVVHYALSEVKSSKQDNLALQITSLLIDNDDLANIDYNLLVDLKDSIKDVNFFLYNEDLKFVWKLNKALKKKKTSTQEKELDSRPDYLTVENGQFTFNIEGSDDSESQYYSLKAHWPKGNSGVTIGRGYDLGNRGTKEDTLRELEQAGLDTVIWEEAIGKKGKEAKDWLEKNTESLPIITHDQQKVLFKIVFQKKEDETKRLATKSDVVKKYGKTDWENLNPVIKEVLIDCTYRGDYDPKIRKFIQTAVVSNDLNEFYKVMSNWDKWKAAKPSLTEHRFNARKTLVAQALGIEIKPEKKQTLAEIIAEGDYPIKSFVGKYNSSQGVLVNQTEDVHKVQSKLVELEILSQEDSVRESKDVDGKIPAENLKTTINAINYFQKVILKFSKQYNYVDPRGSTIKELSNLKLEDKRKIEKAYFDNLKSQLDTKEQAKINAEIWNAERELMVELGGGSESVYTDLLFLRKEFNPHLSGSVGKNEKREGKNETIDVQLVANKLQEQGYPVTSDSVFLGVCDDTLITQIGEYQKSLHSDNPDYKPDNIVDKGGGTFNSLFGNPSKKYSTNLEDIHAGRSAVNAVLGQSMKGAVGTSDNTLDITPTNYPADVKHVARLLQNADIEVPIQSMENGVCNNDLIKAIKEFQKAQGKTEYGIIAAGRSHIKLLETKGVISSGVGDTSNSIGIEVANKPEDVKFVADLLQKSGVRVPSESLKSGTCNDELIAAIKFFEKNIRGNSTQYGVVGKGGGNIKDLLKAKESLKIDKLTYKPADGSHKGGTKKGEYYSKIDILLDKLEIEESSDMGKRIAIARRAATDSNYFESLTAHVSNKLVLPSGEVSSEGISLSPVLVERMRKYHKFMVAAGLYNGDMDLTSGVRGENKAHIWCGQWIIAAEGAGSNNGAKYVEATKKILKEMYLEDKDDGSDYVTDTEGNKWAKKEHFDEDKDGNITLKWDKIKTFVSTIEGGREDYNPPANSGYADGPNRRPVPPKSIGPKPTNHKTGEAMDIKSWKFTAREDSITDVLALTFGIVRAGGASEYWHFELADLTLSTSEKIIENNKTYPEIKKEK